MTTATLTRAQRESQNKARALHEISEIGKARSAKAARDWAAERIAVLEEEVATLKRRGEMGKKLIRQLLAELEGEETEEDGLENAAAHGLDIRMVGQTVPAQPKTVPCGSCGAPVVWGLTEKNQKPCPFNPDGASHFSTCKDAAKWSKPGRMGPRAQRERADEHATEDREMERRERAAIQAEGARA